MKALLLDADGVVLTKDEYFSERFAREYQVPSAQIEPFFKQVYGACQSGTKDLKEELVPYLRDWGWEGPVDSFLEYWFQDMEINPLIESLLHECKQRGISCYLASNNEQYRARRIEEVLEGTIQSCFFSADLKVKKDNPEYFTLVLAALEMTPGEVGFIDNEQKNLDAAASLGIKTFLYSDELIGDFNFLV